MLAHGNSYELLTSTDALGAAQIIGVAERLVTNIGLSRVDRGYATDALSVAKSLYQAREYAEATAQAKRAGALALSLNERFDAFLAAWRALQKSIEEFAGLGFPTDHIEAAMGLAEKRMTVQVEERGGVVPDYLGAIAILRKAQEGVTASLARARDASHEILLATLAVEALSKSPKARVSDGLVAELEARAEEATRELARGRVNAAFRLASLAREDAEMSLAREVCAQPTFAPGDSAVPLAADAREQVLIPAPPDSEPDGVPGADERLPQLTESAVPSSEGLRRALHVLELAQRLRSRFQGEGFSSSEADAALVDAQSALDSGDWRGVCRKVTGAAQVFVRRRDERTALAQKIAELRERVDVLKCVNLPLLPEVHDVLERASEEAAAGRLSDADDFLTCANDLMAMATRLGS